MTTAIHSIYKLMEMNSPLPQDARKEFEKAIYKGDLESVKKIVENGQENLIDFPITQDLKPLHLAVRESRLEIAAYLLEKGANAETPDTQNLNAFDHAALMDDKAMLGLLLSHKLGKDLKEIQEQISTSSPYYPDELREKLKILFSIKGTLSDLSLAAYTGVLPNLTSVPDRFLNQKDENGYSPVHYAILGNKTSSLERLVEAKADLQMVTQDGNSLLHFAALIGSKQIVSRLIELGLDPNLSNARGETPLHYAALQGHISAVDILIKAGAKIDAQNIDGISPLALVAGSASYKDPLKLNSQQLKMFAAASVSWILQLGVFSGYLSNSPIGTAASLISLITAISQAMENSLHPHPLNTLAWFNKHLGTEIPSDFAFAIPLGLLILRHYFAEVDIPVRVYSIYCLGKSILENAKICFKNLHRKQTVARNFFVHAVTVGHSLHGLVQKCYSAFSSASQTNHQPETNPKKKECTPEIRSACRFARALVHTDSNNAAALKLSPIADDIRPFIDRYCDYICKPETDFIEN